MYNNYQQGYVNPYNNSYGVPNFNGVPTYQPFYQPQSTMQQNAPQQATTPQQQMQPTTQIQNIEYVNGIEGAKAYIMQPNSTKWLMDSDGSFFYVKTSNAQNQATVKAYKYVEYNANVTKDDNAEQIEYVTLDEFNKLKKTVNNLIKGKKEVVNE